MSSSSTSSPPQVARLDDVRFGPELLNFLTHALGFFLSLAAANLLIPVAWHCGDAWIATGCAIYAVTLVAVYAASTLSHSFQRPRLRHFFRTVDQVCIFFLIAGSYMPWGLAYFRNFWGIATLTLVWILAFL
jgi:hemolysin III